MMGSESWITRCEESGRRQKRPNYYRDAILFLPRVSSLHGIHSIFSLLTVLLI